MTSPASALTWEIWHRHRNRLLAIASLILGFALLYPKLSVLFGLDLNSPDALDNIASTASERLKDASPLSRVFQVICLLVLLLGPLACMAISLLYVVWIFTFAALDPKKGFGFPTRLFTLPVSTNYLAAWFLGVGTAVLVLVHFGWTHLVLLPHIDVFDGYPNCLGWVTLLVVSQAVMWALDAFPVARVLLLSAAVSGFGYLTGPAMHDHSLLAQNLTVILISFLALGCVVAFVGLNKIRHGSWQRWPWKLHFRRPSRSSFSASASASSSSSSSSPFRSPTRAQFWFEWQSKGGKSSLYASALSGAALLIMSVVAARMGTLSEDDLLGLSLYLLAVPLFIHLAQGIEPQRTLPTFIATRPLASGDIVMEKLKSAALSSVLCWAVTLAMLCIVPLLGDVPTMLEHLPIPAADQSRLRPLLPVIVLGLIFLTWRFAAADLSLGWTGKTWAAKTAVLKLYIVLALGFLLAWLARNPRFEDALFKLLPPLLTFLILLKLVLAQWAFRTSLKRHLLTPSTTRKYLIAWVILAAAFLLPTVVVFHREKWILSLALGIILLLPLARIGFAPLALSLNRHR